jgi:hypothetical protein
MEKRVKTGVERGNGKRKFSGTKRGNRVVVDHRRLLQLSADRWITMTPRRKHISSTPLPYCRKRFNPTSPEGEWKKQEKSGTAFDRREKMFNITEKQRKKERSGVCICIAEVQK